jgi:cytochrome c biogenesis protein CcdA
MAWNRYSNHNQRLTVLKVIPGYMCVYISMSCLEDFKAQQRRKSALLQLICFIPQLESVFSLCHDVALVSAQTVAITEVSQTEMGHSIPDE